MCAGQSEARHSRHADDRHRQPRLPAVLCRSRDRERAQAVAARRSHERPGLRERLRLRAGGQARLREGQGHLDRGALRLFVRPRRQEVRPRHQPGLLHARARHRCRPVGRLLLPVAVGRRPQDQPDREGDLDRGPHGIQVRGAAGHHELRHDPERDQADRQDVRLLVERRRDLGAQGQADRRHRGGPADRLLRHGRPDHGRQGQRPGEHRGPVPGPGRGGRRALQRRAREGQPAHRAASTGRSRQ